MNNFFLTVIFVLLMIYTRHLSELELLINNSRYLQDSSTTNDTTTDNNTNTTTTTDNNTNTTTNEPTPDQLTQNIQNSIRANLVMKEQVAKRMLKKLAFDANRAKWILSNQIDIDDDKRNKILRIFPQLAKKLIKHSVVAGFEYEEIIYK